MTVMTPRGEMKIREWPLDWSNLPEEDLLPAQANRAGAKA